MLFCPPPNMIRTFFVVVLMLAVLAVWSAAPAADWPQWRYDAGRGAVSPEELPAGLHLRWVRRLPEPRPAWPPSQPALRFDVSYSPVAAGKLLFVPSTVTDSVTAYDTDTGEERWRFYTDGPVRLAPVAHGGRVYFGSDDGCLYCVDAAAGRLLWRVRGGPSERRVLGSGRLISTWPVRGGPVLLEGRLYFTAGIWPFMGIFVHAVDAESGKSVWANSGEGCTWTVQPHNSPAFAGLVPRGHLAATAFGLVAPGGRTQPGCYDLRTGRLLGFSFGTKRSASPSVSARGPCFFAGGAMRRIADGKTLLGTAASLHDEKTAYGVLGDEIFAQAIQGERLRPLWTASLSGAPARLFLKAGSRLYAGQAGRVAALEVDTEEGNTKVAWQADIQGEPWTMLAADKKLFVVTTEGRIYCFGADEGPPKTYSRASEVLKTSEVSAAGKTPGPEPGPATPDPETGRAEAILEKTGATEGYCVLFGAGSGRLAAELVRLSALHVIVIDPDAEKVAALRRRMTDAGLYGGRIAAHVGEPAAFRLPPCMAGLVIVEGTVASATDRKLLLGAVFHVLRPYGGAACFGVGAETLKQMVDGAALPGAAVKAAGSSTSLLVREGPLPGAADWTHQYADAANTVVSGDQRVKAPLGLLWFGGPPNDDVLPRHGHGPSPQVAAGRLVIEGRDMLRALDVYTGRLLWQKELPEVGAFYDITSHQPGAGEIGANYVTLPDAVYVVYGQRILQLDAATGHETREFVLEDSAAGAKPNWGFVAAGDELLIAAATPVAVEGSAAVSPAVAGSDGAALEPIIKPHASWRYLAGSDPAGDWTAVDYDDRAWKTGEAGFGYGDGDDRTALAMQGRYARVYVRKEFDAKGAAAAAEMALVVNYDDAFIAYLNGKEVVRAGVGRSSGKGASAIRSHEAGKPETFLIKDYRKLLRPGPNVLAIEGHNASLTSSDFTLDPFLAVKSRGGAAVEQPKPKPLLLADQLAPVRYASASRRLVVYDRHSGKQLWQREAGYSFRHNNIVLGGGKLFAIDGLSQAKQAMLKRRGIDPGTFAPRLLALDARTGREIWSTGEDVFGTFLGYSAEHDVLLEAGSAGRDRARDESTTGMIAYRGADGHVLWKDLARRHTGPCMLHGDTIITQGPAYSLLTGEPKTREHPLTGQPIPWAFTRNYGCNTAIACRNLITFRSAAAGYFDLATDGGTGNLGGFKSGCTSNLIAAGGVLCAPEYTRTCTCTYQNQTSLAMIHDPEVETWTFNALKWDGRPVRRVGINFGAPGDRRAEGGTLWLDWPSTGGPSPDLPLEVEPKQIEAFRHHSGLVRTAEGEGGLVWVAASGIRGVRRLTITLSKEPSTTRRNYTVRMHFAEPDRLAPGARVFDVRLQGKEVLSKLDIAAEAGNMTALVKNFRGVRAGDELTVEFVPVATGTNPGPLLCGIEAVAEGW